MPGCLQTDVKVDEKVWFNNRLYLATSLLKAGSNTVEIRYKNEFDHTGAQTRPDSLV